jgi:hypothetical protein
MNSDRLAERVRPELLGDASAAADRGGLRGRGTLMVHRRRPFGMPVCYADVPGGVDADACQFRTRAG